MNLKNLSQRQKIIIGAASAIIILILIIGIKNIAKPLPTINLEIWGAEDQIRLYQYLGGLYQKYHPNVRINYIVKNSNTYENDLINALAAGKGPDLFIIKNNLIPRYADKVYPLVFDENYNLNQIRETYPEVIETDLVNNNQLYGLPLYLDTLALYYNRSIFDYYNIALPPATWEDATRLSNLFRKTDRYDRLTRAGIALGLGQNIDWSTEILSTLMMQKGASMTDPQTKQAIFYQSTLWQNKYLDSAYEALNFYTNFANPSKTNYTWNKLISNSSIEAFATGKAAMAIGFSTDRKIIREKAPDLNFGISRLPQFANNIKTAVMSRYDVIVVSRSAQNPTISWNFVKFITEQKQAKYYFEQTHYPPARRDLIDFYKNSAELEKSDSGLTVFINQALIAQNWYQINPLEIKKIFDEMIENVVSYGIDAYQALMTACQRINNLSSRF